MGAKIYANCAQLIAHRRIDIRLLSDPSHIDFIAMSGHKIYAPFGYGALIGRRDFFDSSRHRQLNSTPASTFLSVEGEGNADDGRDSVVLREVDLRGQSTAAEIVASSNHIHHSLPQTIQVEELYV